MEGDLYVPTKQLVRVTHDLPDGSSTVVVAIACGYVPIQHDGQSSVAIEVVFDPAMQPPIELPRDGYPCPVSRLERRLLAPKALKKVSVLEVALQETP